MTFAPTQVLRPREQVETQIWEAIPSGSFAQGDKLPPESVLAGQFAVSRTTAVLQHLRIANAIRDQDAARASQSMAAHLDYLASIAHDT
jgi:DNA-binding FadR family transcriptional regulator